MGAKSLKFKVVIHTKVEIPGLQYGEAYYHKFMQYHAIVSKSELRQVNKNTWIAEGNIKYPTAIRVYSSLDTITLNKLFFIQPGVQEFTIIREGEVYASFSSSEIEKEHYNFLKAMHLKTVDDEIDPKQFLSYMKEYRNSYVGFFVLLNQAFKYPYPNEFSEINHLLSEKITRTEAFQFYERLYQPNALSVKAPGVAKETENILSPLFRISKNQRNVVLYFWASWCQYCAAISPFLKEIYDDDSSRDFIIIAISVDRDSSLWRKAIIREGIQKWFHFRSPSFPETLISAPALDMKYSILEYPTLIVIDKAGIIKGRFTGDASEIKSNLINSLHLKTPILK